MVDATPDNVSEEPRRVLLIGQPNVGKTTLFNSLCGLRAHTANIAGSTVDARVGRGYGLRVIDLPGTWSLNLETPRSDSCSFGVSPKKSWALNTTWSWLFLTRRRFAAVFTSQLKCLLKGDHWSLRST